MATKAKNEEIASELEKFQHFLCEMDDVLESFIMTASKARFQFDYSLESLDLLEQYLSQHANLSGDNRLQNQAARYIGEVFRKNLGGKWELCIKPSFLYYRLPVIDGHAVMPLEFCPIQVVSSFVATKEVGLFRRAVNAHVEFLRRA